MQITLEHFSLIAGYGPTDNMRSALEGLKKMGVTAGLNRPHRLAMFLGQTAQESAGWNYDREIWGPTAAQKRYEGRKDLGNTQPGDGAKFKGYTPIQITGRHNTGKFYHWCRMNVDPNCPNFLDYPHLMNTDPWEGLGPIWYWVAGKSQSLNVPADKGDYLAVTKLINGGTNGLKERYRYYGRAALVLLGHPPNSIKNFQQSKGLTPDGIVGEKTLAVLHKELYKLPNITFNDPASLGNIKGSGIFDSIIKFIAGLLGIK